MSCEIHNELIGGRARRVLAVVSECEERAYEVKASFACQGEEVDARWFSSARAALDGAKLRAFEAVILFDGQDEIMADAEEAAMRSAMHGTPIYRLQA